MPIWLRKFTFVEIQNHFKEQNKSSEENTKKNSSTLVDKDLKSGVLPANNLKEAKAYIEDMLKED